MFSLASSRIVLSEPSAFSIGRREDDRVLLRSIKMRFESVDSKGQKRGVKRGGGGLIVIDDGGMAWTGGIMEWIQGFF